MRTIAYLDKSKALPHPSPLTPSDDKDQVAAWNNERSMAFSLVQS